MRHRECTIKLIKSVDSDSRYGLMDAFEKALEEEYDEATHDAWVEHDEQPQPKAKELQARYQYLKHGGEWQRDLLPSDEFASPADNYAAGFLDAMRTIGVKP